MIQKLVIQDFQSHQLTSLDFHKGVNVIMGKTDSGKSAIIRALRWIRYNRPSGDSFISKWSNGKTKVQIFTEGNKITRLKNKSKNIYFVNGVKLEAFGNDVPKEVLQALNLSDINFQYQFDSPFLLNNTSGEVANHFNKIANIDQIDISIKKIQSNLFQLNQQNRINEEALKVQKQELLKYDSLDKFEAELELLEGKNKDMLSLISSKNKINALIEGVKEVQIQIEEKEKITSQKEKVTALLLLYEKKEAKKKEHETLLSIILDVSVILKKIRTKNLLVNLANPVKKIFDLYSMLDGKKLVKNSIQKTINELCVVDQSIKTESNQLIQYKKEFDRLFPEKCPLCGKPK